MKMKLRMPQQPYLRSGIFFLVGGATYSLFVFAIRHPAWVEAVRSAPPWLQAAMLFIPVFLLLPLILTAQPLSILLCGEDPAVSTLGIASLYCGEHLRLLMSFLAGGLLSLVVVFLVQFVKRHSRKRWYVYFGGVVLLTSYLMVMLSLY